MEEKPEYPKITRFKKNNEGNDVLSILFDSETALILEFKGESPRKYYTNNGQVLDKIYCKNIFPTWSLIDVMSEIFLRGEATEGEVAENWAASIYDSSGNVCIVSDLLYFELLTYKKGLRRILDEIIVEIRRRDEK